ncbi:MAG: CDP-diacylglycerol--glycerol-3-phosphate 3-phosphatidyltransferase [Spirochaetaceae bacterium]|jgi:CDP-diacylglycerol--glycerol-3-phosphate 3-phosphatidyltransferase|nr:CDP-diacylglycerol--glycerol-3-phosphate 3-phosphatidyltransferase [Spirochaetaceae bacterium]
MKAADKITAIRILLAPVFCLVYFPPFQTGGGSAPWTVPVLWIIFGVSEITDMLDGFVARKLGEVSDFGKLFDPFADTLVQLSYFLCFVLDGIFPVFLFLVVLYREFSILFVRNLMLRKGIAMGARMTGKIKTLAYIITGAGALGISSLDRLRASEPGFFNMPQVRSGLYMAVMGAFVFSVFLSVLSFIDYVRVYRKAGSEVPCKAS